jgi:RimJ/RimL family protein N-acetyltransferase
MHTARLRLSVPDPATDLDALAGTFADPDGWWYEPASRHTTPAQTRDWLTRAAARWPTDGLSYWTVRLAAGGDPIGTGGAQRHRSGAWNLSYRIAAAHQGHGYATELGRAALEAAARVDPGAPCIAFVLEHNHPSRRVAVRLGLVDRGLRMDRSDGTPRLAYADRELDEERFPPIR